MGMKEMFSNGAQFDELLDSSEPLKISEAVHKAVIEVNEDGAEAAAFNGEYVERIIITFILLPILPAFKMVMLCNCGDSSDESVNFTANHPFMFVLLKTYGNGKKLVLFSGRVKQF